jgi:paraquat-inducible protein B
MKKKRTTFLVGLFTVCALFLLIGLLYFLGNMSLFSKGNRYVLYFNESVNGLNVGSPVKLRGVPIGSVQEILVDTNLDDDLHLIPVVVEILPERLKGIDGETLDWTDPKEMEKQIHYGLRGKLQQLSFITGQIYIELDYLKHGSRFAIPKYYHYGKIHMVEIPTIPSTLAEISEVLVSVRDNLHKINFKAMGDSFAQLLDNLNENLAGDRIGTAFADASDTIKEIREMISKPEIQKFLDGLAPTLDSIHSVSKKVDAKIEPMEDEVIDFLKKLEQTLDKLNLVIEEIGQVTHPESEVRIGTAEALKSMGQAASALSRFLDFLDRNPDALMKGRTD